MEVYRKGTYQPVPAGFIRESFSIPGQQSYDMGTLVLQETVTFWGVLKLEDKTGAQADHSGSFVSVEGYTFFAVTDSDGYFYLSKLPPHDNYLIRCEHAGYKPLVLGPVVVRPGNSFQGGEQATLERLDP